MINRKNILNIIEGIVLIGLIVFVIVIMSSNSSKDVPMTQIKEVMLELPGANDLIQKDAPGTKASFGMVPSDYIYYKTEDIMDVRELFIAKTSDDKEMEQIEDAVASRLATQIDNFTGYGTNQIDLLNHAISMQKGDYYFYAVGENADQWQSAFLKLVG